SDSCPETDFVTQQEDAIGWLMDELGLEGIPAIGLGNGAAALCKLAANRPSKFSRLLVTGLLKPYSKETTSRFTPTQKVVIKLLRYAPKTSETLARVCYRYVQQKGADWYLDHALNDVPEVSHTLANPEIIPLIRNACQLTLTGNVRDYLEEMQIQWNIDPEKLHKVLCPVSHLHGEHDRSVTAEEARELEARMANFTSEEVQDAGYFLAYEKPDLFADRLIKTIIG
ncbi:MAG: alpha/beta hydrolase, partial [Pseudomonadota bacterium]